MGPKAATKEVDAANSRNSLVNAPLVYRRCRGLGLRAMKPPPIQPERDPPDAGGSSTVLGKSCWRRTCSHWNRATLLEHLDTAKLVGQ